MLLRISMILFFVIPSVLLLNIINKKILNRNMIQKTVVFLIGLLLPLIGFYYIQARTVNTYNYLLIIIIISIFPFINYMIYRNNGGNRKELAILIVINILSPLIIESIVVIFLYLSNLGRATFDEYETLKHLIINNLLEIKKYLPENADVYNQLHSNLQKLFNVKSIVIINNQNKYEDFILLLCGGFLGFIASIIANQLYGKIAKGGE